MIAQALILLLGTMAVWCSQSPATRAQRWAPVLGLIAQPFWIITTWQAEQWGMLALSLVYTAAWLRGIRTYWLQSPKGRS